jgi:hypothetical protein
MAHATAAIGLTVQTMKIRTVDEFKLVLDTLCHDLGRANNHYTLVQKLAAAVTGAYGKALSQSPTFWPLTQHAHYDAAIFRLCRIYDQDSDNLALRGFLETVDACPAFLPEPTGFQRVNAEHLQADLDWARDTNPLVHHLMMWRHKEFAHRDIRARLSGFLNDHPVGFDDIEQLLTRGFDIMNRYSVIFFNTAFMRDMLGLDDYERVLRVVDENIASHERQLDDQIERARRESQDSGDSDPR